MITQFRSKQIWCRDPMRPNTSPSLFPSPPLPSPLTRPPPLFWRNHSRRAAASFVPPISSEHIARSLLMMIRCSRDVLVCARIERVSQYVLLFRECPTGLMFRRLTGHEFIDGFLLILLSPFEVSYISSHWAIGCEVVFCQRHEGKPPN